MRSVVRSVRDVFAFFFDFLCFRSESDEESEDTLRERALDFFLDGLGGRSEPDEEEDALRFLGFFFSLLPLSEPGLRRTASEARRDVPIAVASVRELTQDPHGKARALVSAYGAWARSAAWAGASGEARMLKMSLTACSGARFKPRK